MRVVWRLCQRQHARNAFSGEGARRYGGRWNEKGTPLVYCSSSIALATLEVLVHARSLPAGYVKIRVAIPNDVRIDRWRARALPRRWNSTPGPASLQAMGSRWAAAGRAVALEVPSVLVEDETNVLINPLHPDMDRLVLSSPEAFGFDPRLRTQRPRS